MRSGLSALSLAALAVLGTTMTAAPLRAQVVGTEAAFHSVRYRGVDVREVTVPFGVTWRYGRFRVDANTAYARATLSAEDGGTVADISGLTDATARLMVKLFDDRARLIVAGNIPTGTATLDPTQDAVATALATQLFAFPVATFGSGAGVTTGVAAAHPVGDFVVGVSGAYRMGGGYEPLAPVGDAETLEFQPGQEVRVRVAVDRPVRDRWAYRLAASWSAFGWDRQNGRDFFRPGNRLLFDGMVEAPVAAGTAALYGWHMMRSAGSVQDTLGAVLNAASSRAFSGAALRVTLPVTPTILLRPAADLYIQNTSEGEGVTVADGYLARAGVGVAFRMRNGMVFEPAAKLQLGSLDGEAIRGVVIRGGFAWAR